MDKSVSRDGYVWARTGPNERLEVRRVPWWMRLSVVRTMRARAMRKRLDYERAHVASIGLMDWYTGYFRTNYGLADAVERGEA